MTAYHKSFNQPTLHVSKTKSPPSSYIHCFVKISGYLYWKGEVKKVKNKIVQTEIINEPWHKRQNARMLRSIQRGGTSPTLASRLNAVFFRSCSALCMNSNAWQSTHGRPGENNVQFRKKRCTPWLFFWYNVNNILWIICFTIRHHISKLYALMNWPVKRWLHSAPCGHEW